MAKKSGKTEKKKISQEELEKEVVSMAKKEMTASKIGLAIEKEYGIKSEKKIQEILKKAGIKSELPEELDCLIKNAEMLKKHLVKNKMDKVAERGLQITRAKINKTIKYFKEKRILPATFTYKL